MPPVSEAQRRLMHMAAAGKSTKVPQKVGREFIRKDQPGKLPERKTRRFA
jgi:hypothetical protein